MLNEKLTKDVLLKAGQEHSQIFILLFIQTMKSKDNLLLIIPNSVDLFDFRGLLGCPRDCHLLNVDIRIFIGLANTL